MNANFFGFDVNPAELMGLFSPLNSQEKKGQALQKLVTGIMAQLFEMDDVKFALLQQLVDSMPDLEVRLDRDYYEDETVVNLNISKKKITNLTTAIEEQTTCQQ